MYKINRTCFISLERMLWILNTTHHRRIMNYYNSPENVNSKKTMQAPNNFQRKARDKDCEMIEAHEEGGGYILLFLPSDHRVGKSSLSGMGEYGEKIHM